MKHHVTNIERYRTVRVLFGFLVLWFLACGISFSALLIATYVINSSYTGYKDSFEAGLDVTGSLVVLGCFMGFLLSVFQTRLSHTEYSTKKRNVISYLRFIHLTIELASCTSNHSVFYYDWCLHCRCC